MTPEQFLRTMYEGASHNAVHFHDPDREKREAARAGYAEWAKMYKACLDLIEQLRKQHDDHG